MSWTCYSKDIYVRDHDVIDSLIEWNSLDIIMCENLHVSRTRKYQSENTLPIPFSQYLIFD